MEQWFHIMTTCNRSQTKGNLFLRKGKLYTIKIGEMIKTNHYLRLSLIMISNVTMESIAKRRQAFSCFRYLCLYVFISFIFTFTFNISGHKSRIHASDDFDAGFIVPSVIYFLICSGNYYVTHTFSSIIKNRTSFEYRNRTLGWKQKRNNNGKINSALFTRHAKNTQIVRR